MTPHDPTDSHEVDPLVRAHLEREAATVDARAMLTRVRTVLPQRPTRWRLWAKVGVGMATAVAASLVVLVLFAETPTQKLALAAPADVLREAKQLAEIAPADCCYTMIADWETTPFQKRLGIRPLMREATVWTRGDEFVVLSALADGEAWAWGQTTEGRVWIAPNRRRALVFEGDELSEPLARYCEFMSLRLASTLGELLEKHDLARRDTGKPDEPIHIVARARKSASPGVVRLERVELFLDSKTKVIQQATLTRQLNGENIGEVRFVLKESRAQADEFYTPRGHIDADALVLERKPGPTLKFDPRSRFREELLRRFSQKDR